MLFNCEGTSGEPGPNARLMERRSLREQLSIVDPTEQRDQEDLWSPTCHTDH